MSKEKELLSVLNQMINNCEPIYYMDFNKFYKGNEELVKLEENDNRIGLAFKKKELLKNEKPEVTGISTLSLIATITDVLIDKRLAARTEEDGRIVGFDIYQ